MAKTNIPATGATSRTPRTMNFPASSPNPPTSAAAVGTTISATIGDTRLLRMAASRETTVSKPSKASMGQALPGEREVGRHVDLQAEDPERKRVPVRVQAEGVVDAPVESPPQHEVQRAQPGQHVPAHAGRRAVPEGLRHAARGHLLDQDREEVRPV